MEKMSLAIYSGRQKPAEYIKSFQSHVLLLVSEKHRPECIFRQQNESINTYRIGKECFTKHKNTVLIGPRSLQASFYQKLVMLVS